MKVSDLIPDGCSVVTYDTVSTVHDPEGAVIAVVCAGKHNAEIARLLAALPALMEVMDNAIERGLLLPILYGMRRLDREVFDQELLPAA